MEDLIKRMSNLSLAEKKILYNEIARLIRQDIVKSIEREDKDMESVKLLLYDILGIDEYVPSSRERKQVVFRTILANLFLKMGKGEEEVGRMMNKDHSTIHHYKVIMQDWFDYPSYYQEELSYWNQINALL